MSTTTPPNAERGETEKQNFSFLLILEGIDEISESASEALYNAGCGDALFGMVNGRVYVEFDRESESAMEAIVSAIDDVERGLPSVRVTQVVPPGERAMETVNAYLRLRATHPELMSKLISSIKK